MKIVHRDLKPENIFINKKMEIKIGDFGISKQLNIYTTQITNNKAGCIYYMAPEILEKGIYNIKSDIWSLGCIIYELLTLNIYYIDKFKNNIQKIDTEIYNYNWQKLISLLLKYDYNKRLDINQVYNILENDINNKENNIIKNEVNKYENKIIGEIYIKENDINNDIQIINSFENCKKVFEWEDEKDDYEYENEKEIKENIEIKINGKIIEFTYNYKFKNEGKYKIEYLFKNNLTKTCCMFHGCISLTNLNLSNFNIQNVTSMFSGCNSLTKKNIITKDN